MRNKTTFYEVNKKDVDILQSKLDFPVPESLVELWEKIGYGFVYSDNCRINRIMDPLSLMDFRFRQGDFESYSDIEIYSRHEKDKLIFFESDENAYISIGFDSENLGKIFYYGVEIASSLEEFLMKLSQDDLYFLDVFNNSISH